MKISEFIFSVTGLLVSWQINQLVPAIIFGVLAILAFRRIMAEVEDQAPEDEQIEGGTEPWEGIWKKIIRKEARR